HQPPDAFPEGAPAVDEGSARLARKVAFPGTPGRGDAQQHREQEPRHHTGDEEIADRGGHDIGAVRALDDHARGGHGIHHHHDRRRDQDTEPTRTRDRGDPDRRRIALFHHLLTQDRVYGHYS